MRGVLFGLLLIVAGQVMAEELPVQSDDVIKLFEECVPASRHAQKLLEEVLEQLAYQGPSIRLCRSLVIPSVVAWSRLVSFEPHPYIGWKKLPVTQAYISYNPALMAQLERPQAAVAMAHEVAHHIKGHFSYETPLQGLAPTTEQEQEADYYAGLLMAKMKMSDVQFVEARELLYSLSDYGTDDELGKRSLSLLKGWKAGGGQPLDADVSAYSQLGQRW